VYISIATVTLQACFGSGSFINVRVLNEADNPYSGQEKSSENSTLRNSFWIFTFIFPFVWKLIQKMSCPGLSCLFFQ
jgi:hypothetical protein